MMGDSRSSYPYCLEEMEPLMRSATTLWSRTSTLSAGVVRGWVGGGGVEGGWVGVRGLVQGDESGGCERAESGRQAVMLVLGLCTSPPAPHTRQAGARTRARHHQGVEDVQRLRACLGVAVGNLGGVQTVAQQALRVGQQLARKRQHLRGCGGQACKLAAAAQGPQAVQRPPAAAAAAGSRRAAPGAAHCRPHPRAMLVPSPISCCCAWAAMTSSLAAGCCTSSSAVMVDASLVTNSFSRWLITILFMPGGRRVGGAEVRVRQAGAGWSDSTHERRRRRRFSGGGWCGGRRVPPAHPLAIGAHAGARDYRQLLAGLDVLEHRLLQARNVLVPLLEHSLTGAGVGVGVGRWAGAGGGWEAAHAMIGAGKAHLQAVRHSHGHGAELAGSLDAPPGCLPRCPGLN